MGGITQLQKSRGRYYAQYYGGRWGKWPLEKKTEKGEGKKGIFFTKNGLKSFWVLYLIPYPPYPPHLATLVALNFFS